MTRTAPCVLLDKKKKHSKGVVLIEFLKLKVQGVSVHSRVYIAGALCVKCC